LNIQVLSAGDNEEMCYCLKAWQALPRSVQFGAQPSTVEALQATAVVDRIRRALGDISTSTTDRIQVPPHPFTSLNRSIFFNSSTFTLSTAFLHKPSSLHICDGRCGRLRAPTRL
jgi:hypothetical protein